MEQNRKKKKWYFVLLGLAAGILNGLFGAGGGVAVVPMLEKADIEPKKAHATSISIILPLSILSGIFYLTSGHISFETAFPYLPLGVVGALLGGWLLKKIPNDLLRRIFGIIIILSAVRIFFK
ncbi:MAG: sulfite exporter TauE/SafE family protein [Clostridiales bacterium]|nr:sulfite exporter TauE/SafE family protein [Clostridiales bacterium]